MGRMLLVTDHPGRSEELARDLAGGPPCDLHDLYGEETLAGEPASMILADVLDLGLEAVERLRRLRARTRHGVPLILLLHQESQRARLLSVALGATHTLYPPFDTTRLRALVGAPPAMPAYAEADPVTAHAARRAAHARLFFSTVFVPGRPITPAVIDYGTNFIGQAVRDTGIRDWVRAVRQFDDITHQHCLLVAGLAAAFALSLGLGERECHRLTRGALLHDVGKIHVPAEILNKPGKLTNAEMAVMRLHPRKGHAMLAGQGFEPEMLAVVRSHHEMLDGSGYPDGLNGDEIPDLIRLVTVCDIYAALIERRPYKAPMTGEAALGILEGMTGRLDPAIVNAFRPVSGAFTSISPLDV